MNTIFKLESRLVDSFVSLYKKSDLEVLMTELPIRFGNIDIVGIKSSNLPFSSSQVETLSKPAAALIFTKIKNERPITKQTLIKGLGLSKSTIDHSLYDLLSVGLVEKNGENIATTRIKSTSKHLVTWLDAIDVFESNALIV